MPMPFEEMAGVFDIELHDVDETVEVDSEDDAIQVEEVQGVHLLLRNNFVLVIAVEMRFQCRRRSSRVKGQTYLRLGWDDDDDFIFVEWF